MLAKGKTMTDMTVPAITFDVAVKGINNAIVDKGSDHVYGSGQCSYVEFDIDGLRSSCIVGHFLVNTLGIDPKVFEEEGINFGCGAASALDVLVSIGLIESVTDKALSFLNMVQNSQDSRETWGEALVLAMEEMDTRKNWYNADEMSV